MTHNPTIEALKTARLNGIGPTGAVMLILVMEYGPIKPTELAKLAGSSPAHVTGAIDRLMSAGWVMRQEVGNLDRRTKPISATLKAFELFNKTEA
jgi:DNA-binding MarR family transcriptional regulator